MTRDLERDLRSMMQQAADGLNHVPRASRGLVRRARARRAQAATLAGATMLALVVGGLAGVRSLSNDGARPVPPAERPSPTGPAATAIEGTVEVHSRAVRGSCELLLTSCPDELPGNHLLTVQVLVIEEDGEVFGSGIIEGGTLDESFTARCSRKIDDTSTAVGGTFDEGERAGEGMAFVVKDRDPDKVAIWFDESGIGSSDEEACHRVLEGIETRGWDDLIFETVEKGDFTLRDEDT